jgi:hypothetical protein
VEIIKQLSGEIETATAATTITTTTNTKCPEPSSQLSSRGFLEEFADFESDGDNMMMNDIHLFPQGIVLHEQPAQTIDMSALDATTDTHVPQGHFI